MERISHFLTPKGTNGAWTWLFAAVIFIATGVTPLDGRPPEPVQQSSASVQHPDERAETLPYSRWLNQDVVYIINEKERAAFQKLKTDEERDKFIEQFWARRNPNPGSTRNEFKEEHYRRIAYANGHFAASNPGWQTDRGHIYILYGPPDEVESHPADRPHPFEEWMYRSVSGLGENVMFKFIDRTGKGDYQLAPGSPVKK